MAVLGKGKKVPITLLCDNSECYTSPSNSTTQQTEVTPNPKNLEIILFANRARL